MGDLKQGRASSVVGPQLGMCVLGGRFSTSLHTRMSSNDCESGGSADLGVTNKIELVGELACMRSTNDGDQLYVWSKHPCNYHPQELELLSVPSPRMCILLSESSALKGVSYLQFAALIW